MTLPPVAILAGGLATRMRPHTERVPKSLLGVAGAPFLAHQLRLLHRQGFTRVVLCVGHLGEMIERFLAEHGTFGLDVKLSWDGDVQRGTGGALANALSLLPDKFFVLYGDSYLDINVAPVHAAFEAAGMPVLMTVLHNCDRFDRSNIVFDGRNVLIHNKSATRLPNEDWIDFGLSVWTKAAVRQHASPVNCDLSAITGLLARKGRLAGYEVKTRFYEIGTPAGLHELHAYLCKG